MGAVGEARKPLVKSQARRQMGNVIRRNAGRQRQVNARRRQFRFRRAALAVALAVAPVVAINAAAGRLPAQIGHRLAQQLRVQVEAHRLYLPALVRAQQVAGAPDFQVAHRDAEAGAQLVGLQDGVDALPGGVRDFPVGGNQQVGIGAVVAPAHPAPQLVQLRQPEAVGPVNDDGIHIGHIQAGFNDGGADQHIRFPVGESHHHILQLRFGHLPVSHQKAGFGNQPGQFVRRFVNGADAVVQKKRLPVPLQFPEDGFAHRLAPVLGDEGFHRQPGFRRRGDDAHIPDAGQRHMQRAGNGRGAQGQHIHLGAQLLEAFLVPHAEAVFLVNDDQPQIVETHILLQNAVGADDDVRPARFGGGDHFSLLAGAAKPA